MQTKTNEKRRNPRISTYNEVIYIIYDRQGVKIGKGKGHTINLSQNGVMLETPTALEGVFIVLLTIDLEGKNLTIKGRLAHIHTDATSGRFLSGIKFIDPQDKQREVIVAFVKAYHHRKHLAVKMAKAPKTNEMRLVSPS